MRVTTNLIYNLNQRAINSSQGNLSDVQQQLSSGKKLLRPSDDPVGASQVIRLTEDLDKITQYNRNNDLATNSLELQETAMRSINSIVNRAREQVVRAGSGIVSGPDREAIGKEIEQIRNQVLGLMNSQNSNGDYIFAGFQSKTQAFEFNPSGTGKKVTFKGDDGTNEVQISNSVKIQSSSSGKSVFENAFARLNYTASNASGITLEKSTIEHQNSFDSFHRQNFDASNPANNDYQFEILPGDQIQVTNLGTGAVVDTIAFENGNEIAFNGIRMTMDGSVGSTIDVSLDRPDKKNLAETLNEMFEALSSDTITEQEFMEKINDTLVGLDNGLGLMALESSSIGARLNIADSVKGSNLDSEIANQKARSTIQDVDYAYATAEFAKQETALQAAFATFPKVTNLTLFNYIN